MNAFGYGESPLQKLSDHGWESRNIHVFVKRDDLIHSEVSGNKWRKLKYNLAQASHLKKSGILTFGGAYSNHLLATASACNDHGIQSIGIVRGDELSESSNPTLARCAELGMQLEFVPRNEYALKSEKGYIETLQNRFPDYRVVPEGGANYYGIIGCQEIVRECDGEIDHFFLAQGTTTTSCGVLLALAEHQHLTVVPVLKGFESRKEMEHVLMRASLSESSISEYLQRVTVLDDYHFGGYARYSEELIEFIRFFHRKFGIRLDPVYTGKVAFAMWQELEKPEFEGKSVVLVHSGGLHGIPGIEARLGEKLF